MPSSRYRTQFSYINEQKLQTPVTFYDENNLLDALAILRHEFGPQTEIYYALKSCYNSAVLKSLSKMGLGTEVLSELEYEIAKKNDFSSIILNGMGRSSALLKKATLDNSLIIVDTVNDIDVLSEIAKTANQQIRVGFRLRLNLKEWELDNSYVAKNHPLGNDIDSEFLEEFMKFCKNNTNVSWEMLHVHITINETSPEIYIKALYEIRQSIVKINDSYHLTPKIINIGGGFEVFDPARKKDFQHMFSEIKKAFHEQLGDYILAIEPGRYLSAYAGYTIGKVVDLKPVDEKYWIITDIGTNILIPIPNARYKLGYPRITGNGEKIVGITDGITSPANNIINQIFLDKLPKLGSFICIENTGAYTDVYSTFWAYAPHVVCFVTRDNEITIYRDLREIEKLKEIILNKTSST